jgi:hypothetical protein
VVRWRRVVVANEVEVHEREREREERKGEEREEEEEAAHQFKLAPVTLDWLARLSRAAYSNTNGEHMVQASWAASRTIVDDATQSRHKTWRD